KSAASPAQVYLMLGDLERAFDTPQFRPDAAIVPTNTDLSFTASSPATQRVLVDRVKKQPAVMRDLQDQIAARRKPSAAATSSVLNIGLDWFVAQLPRQAAGKDQGGAFPKAVCLI